MPLPALEKRMKLKTGPRMEQRFRFPNTRVRFSNPKWNIRNSYKLATTCFVIQMQICFPIHHAAADRTQLRFGCGHSRVAGSVTGRARRRRDRAHALAACGMEIMTEPRSPNISVLSESSPSGVHTARAPHAHHSPPCHLSHSSFHQSDRITSRYSTCT